MLRYARMDRVWHATAGCRVLPSSELELGHEKPEPYIGRLIQHFWCHSLGKRAEPITKPFSEKRVDRLGRSGQ